MRKLPLIAILILIPARSLVAQQVGDQIVTIQRAQVKTQNEIVGSVPKGNVLTVKDLNDESLYITWSHGKATIKGWIDRRNVVSLDKALDFFNDELQRNPDEEAYANRGMIRVARKEFDIALGDYNEAIRLDPTQFTNWKNRGFIWSRKGDQDKAIADYNEAIRLDPKDAGAYYLRGFAWSRKGDYDKAISDYNEAIRIDPEDTAPYHQRGLAWAEQGDHARAILDYNEAIRLAPKLATTFRNRGFAWEKKKEFDKAIADYSEAIRLDPRSAAAYRNRGNAWGTQGDPDKAIADYNEAIRIDPKNAEVYHNRAPPGGRSRNTTRPSPITVNPFDSIRNRPARTTNEASRGPPKEIQTRRSPTTTRPSGSI